MDGLVRTHSDWLFGSVEGQNLLRPFADIIALDDEFLSGKVKDRGPWIEDDQYLWTRAVSPNGWIAVQVWGFQDVTVGGKQERRFCRNVVVTKGGQKAQIRMVYDYSPTA
jgi:hypothetical protein